ncbi:MAG TPA: endonuclease/exonuclease/phosphatase family protein, partial [Acidimicrobiales bacterium]|nr:endonuclease/exonuclease/phosphatase family protein [Acidimicrobiales bacterium]
MTELRVATFNVRNGRALDGFVRAWPFRRRAVVAAIASLDADVVGLQEAYRFQLRSLLRGLQR